MWLNLRKFPTLAQIFQKMCQKTILRIKKRSLGYFLEHFLLDLSQNEQLSEIKPTLVSYCHRCAHYYVKWCIKEEILIGLLGMYFVHLS